ncbi:O-acetyl-ADP-ribose deacetylase MACROD2 [Micractinium conductrix]|uniref:O-acetyl-ADP-ribose deacetylase MACROD2 n=1 Tax=Micractinium conductrix TaxID=554055 RepID=A0A2P6VKT9_9CHLO|nr:O-acetyl-ADP-ribose deacetylase MACROD2 [Micractinium conductrix]|eukprot:PSC74698.1 O-acetyl-ADP-ribose deacetylase MACROD2 [Micractinium conductrix]
MAAVSWWRLSPTTRLAIRRGDLTKFDGCAIVNAANERMLGGGGVDGAIHRAAGPALLEACKQVPEVRRGVRCPRGEARVTPGGDLPARHVIHTVGPVYSSPATSAPLLEGAYASSLRLANEHKLERVAFPAISCGVFGYPLDESAEIAVRTSQREAGSLQEIHFFLFGQKELDAWLAAAREAGLAEETSTAAAEGSEGEL